MLLPGQDCPWEQDAEEPSFGFQESYSRGSSNRPRPSYALSFAEGKPIPALLEGRSILGRPWGTACSAATQGGGDFPAALGSWCHFSAQHQGEWPCSLPLLANTAWFIFISFCAIIKGEWSGERRLYSNKHGIYSLVKADEKPFIARGAGARNTLYILPYLFSSL